MGILWRFEVAAVKIYEILIKGFNEIKGSKETPSESSFAFSYCSRWEKYGFEMQSFEIELNELILSAS